jgi:uncharacterized protein (DUF736 family)
MNKKRLLCVALTAVLTVTSTAIIAFASENSASTTKNVVKVAVASDKKVVPASKSATSERITITDTKVGIGYNGVGDKDDALNYLTAQLEEMEIGRIKSTPEEIQALKNFINDIKSGKMTIFHIIKVPANSSQVKLVIDDNLNVKLLNISDAQAIQTAKDAIKYYTGVDVDKVINRDGLKPFITRTKSPYAWGPDILVSFNSNRNTSDNIFAEISAVDGKVYNVTAMVDSYSKTNIDESKVKDAAISFLKDKGFGTNFTSITVDYEKVSGGIVGAKALYADGTEILMEFDADNNSVVNFTHYNLKTMKFEN